MESRLEKDLLDILLIIREFEFQHPEDPVGYEFDYLQDRVGTQKAEEAFAELEKRGLIYFPFEDKKSVKTTPKSRTICNGCGSYMIIGGGQCLSLIQIEGMPEGPKRQIQRRYFCPNPDCSLHKEEPALVIEDIE